jgi:pyruvate,orthophosphate dikinase
MIWCARCTGGCPRTDRYATSGRARRTTSAAASHFTELFAAMDGLPTTIRLLDPPLHEFLPDLTVRLALAQERGNPNLAEIQLLNEVRRRHEQNSMLRSRGVRLGLLIPGLVQMQVRAITQAATDQCDRGG